MARTQFTMVKPHMDHKCKIKFIHGLYGVLQSKLCRVPLNYVARHQIVSRATIWLRWLSSYDETD